MKAICSVMVLIGISSCYGANHKKVDFDIKKEFISSLKKIDDFQYSLGRLNHYLEDTLIDLTQLESSEDKELRKNNRNYKNKGQQIIESIQKYSKEAKEKYKAQSWGWAPVSYTRGIEHAIGKHFPGIFDLVGKGDVTEISGAIDIHRYIQEDAELSDIKRELLNISQKKSNQQLVAYGILGYLSIIKMIQNSDGFMRYTYDHVISDKTIKSELADGVLDEVKPQNIKSTGLAFFINNVYYVGKWSPKVLFIPIHNKFTVEKDIVLNTAIASIYMLDSVAELECKFNPGRKVKDFSMPKKYGMNEYLTKKMSVKYAMNGMLKKAHNLTLPKYVEQVEKSEPLPVEDIQIPDSVTKISDIEKKDTEVHHTVMNMQDTEKQICRRMFNMMDEDIESEIIPYCTKYVNKPNGAISYYRIEYIPSMQFKTDKVTGMEQVSKFVTLLENYNKITNDSNPSKKHLLSLIDTFSKIRDSGTDDLSLLCEIGCINTFFETHYEKDKFFEAHYEKDKFFEEYLSVVLMQDLQRVFIETIGDNIINIFEEYPITEQNLIDIGDTSINRMIKRKSKAYAKKYLKYFADKYSTQSEYEAYKKNSSAINNFFESSAYLRALYNQIHDTTREYCRMAFAIGSMEEFMKSSMNDNMPAIHTRCKRIIDELNKTLVELESNKYENACAEFIAISDNDQATKAMLGNKRFYKDNESVLLSLKNVIGLLQIILNHDEYSGELSEFILITCKQIDVLFNKMFS